MGISGYESPYSWPLVESLTDEQRRRAAAYTVETLGKDDAPSVLEALLGPEWRQLAGAS